jgi:hypothetical protein
MNLAVNNNDLKTVMVLYEEYDITLTQELFNKAVYYNYTGMAHYIYHSEDISDFIHSYFGEREVNVFISEIGHKYILDYYNCSPVNIKHLVHALKNKIPIRDEYINMAITHENYTILCYLYKYYVLSAQIIY